MSEGIYKLRIIVTEVRQMTSDVFAGQNSTLATMLRRDSIAKTLLLL